MLALCAAPPCLAGRASEPAPGNEPGAFLWLQNPWTGEQHLTQLAAPDTSLWNPVRIQAHSESQQADGAPPLAVLSIEALDLQAPVFNGADELNLNRGLARIPGTARIDEAGNLAISGHRDGFFRVLKDLQEGDSIRLQTPRGEQRFTVRSMTIVDKEDHSLLAPTPDTLLTLVTCYPFYFVGNAPQRLVVRASPQPRAKPITAANP